MSGVGWVTRGSGEALTPDGVHRENGRTFQTKGEGAQDPRLVRSRCAQAANRGRCEPSKGMAACVLGESGRFFQFHEGPLERLELESGVC